MSFTPFKNIKLLITQSHSSIAQATSSFKHLDMYTFMHAIPTFVTEALCVVTQVYVAAFFNKCYCKLIAYTVLAYSYWVSFHDVYQC